MTFNRKRMIASVTDYTPPFQGGVARSAGVVIRFAQPPYRYREASALCNRYATRKSKRWLRIHTNQPVRFADTPPWKGGEWGANLEIDFYQILTWIVTRLPHWHFMMRRGGFEQ
jgi:hypothetical protein